MTGIRHILFPPAALALALALPSAAPAQDRCAAELDRLEADVQESELSEQERTKYQQLMEGATALRDAGEEEDCLATIDSIRRILFIYPETGGQSTRTDQAE